MGHHSKKNSQSIPIPEPNSPFDINNIGRLLNNVDISAMSSTLSNMDLNQVMSVLSKAFTSNLSAQPSNTSVNTVNSTQNSAPADIPGTPPDMAPASGYLNSFKNFNIPDLNQMNTSPNTTLSHILPPNDPTVMILNSLKPLLPPDKCVIIDNMIQIYGIKKVIDKIFPPSIQTNGFYARNNSGAGSSGEQTADKSETAGEIN